MTLLQSFRLAITPQADLDTIDQWRGQLLSSILYFVTLLGFVVAIPSVIFASDQGLWSVALVDTVALAWIVTISRRRSLSFNVRAWNFCALLYVLGVFFLFTVGMVSQIYLMGFSVMVVLLFGLRPAMFALALNAVTLVGIGYLTDADLNVVGFEAQSLLKWIVITINFMFINASITLSTGVLLHGLQRSLERNRDSEILYRTAFVTSPDAVNINRLSDGLFLEVNDGFVKMLGWTRDEIQGRTSLEINVWHNPQDRQGLVDALRLDGHYENLEAQFDAKSGRVVTGLMSAHVMEIRGEPCILSVTRDITERKAAEGSQRVAAIAFETQQAMFITDAQKVILRVNKAFTEITGYTAEESVGQTPSLLKSGRQDPAFYTAMWECISRTGTWQGEIWNRRKNGTVYAEHLSVSAVKNDAGTLTHYVGSFSDLTAYKAAEEQIHDLAFTDLLTGLPNRRHLIVRLQQAITAGESQQYQSALLILNLDNFKNLNSTLGRAQCDQILQHVAKRLNAAVGDGNTVAHVEGDQFAVILTDLNQHPQQMLRQVEAAAGKMLEAINQPYQLAGSTILCTASVGITFFAAQYEETIEPLKRAELALQQAKIAGRNTLRFFDADMQAVVDARIALEAALRQAINNKYFVLYYQAQVSDSEGIVGVEALIRWIDPKRGMVSPVEFIPLAEETGLILPIGAWVLETACQQLAAWADQPAMAHLCIAVNVSARQFRESNFVSQTLATLERTRANPQRLKLELTESVLIADAEDVILKMNALKAIGIGFAIDDFGTGYSSLSYLKRLPLERLKIDQGFVRNILMDPDDAAISRAVIAMATSMGLGVIAEGVETEAQRDFLASLGCHNYQGYLFSKPAPVQEFEALAARF